MNPHAFAVALMKQPDPPKPGPAPDPDGPTVLKDARDRFEHWLRTPRPLVHGVPQAALFQNRRETMAGHLAGMRRTVRRELRVLEAMTRGGPCGIEPAVYRPCVVTTWRAR